MQYEPMIDHRALLAAVRARYGIWVDDLTFVPVGAVAACYALRAAGKPQYFLKLWLTMPTASAGATGAAAEPYRASIAGAFQPATFMRLRSWPPY